MNMWIRNMCVIKDTSPAVCFPEHLANRPMFHLFKSIWLSLVMSLMSLFCYVSFDVALFDFQADFAPWTRCWGTNQFYCNR